MGEISIIGGQFNRRKIKVFDHPQLRPTGNRARETLFNWLMPTLNEAYCLDAFAGTGALGLEALSRGASSCTFLETHSGVYQQLLDTLQRLSIQHRHQVIQRSAQAYLSSPSSSHTAFDIVFLDPPFDEPHLLINCLSLLQKCSWLHANSLVYIETQNPIPTQLQDVLPDWQIKKDKKIGDVRCLLLSQR